MQLVMLSPFYRQKAFGWSDDWLKIINYQLVKNAGKTVPEFWMPSFVVYSSKS